MRKQKHSRLVNCELVWFYFAGQFLAQNSRFREAAECLLKASSLDGSDYEIISTTANVLRQAKRYDEAEYYYRKAVLLRPNDATGHVNLGAMLHLNGKLDEAESSYLDALRLKPDDNLTKSNLAKLRHLVERKRQQVWRPWLLPSEIFAKRFIL